MLTRGCEYLLMPGLTALAQLAAPGPSPLERIPEGEPDATDEVVHLDRYGRQPWRS